MGSPAGLGSGGPAASRAAKTAKCHLRYEVAFVLAYKGERDAIAAIAKAQAHARGERSHALRASALSWCSSPALSRRAWRPFRAAAAVRFRLPCAARRAWESDAQFEVPAVEQSARWLGLFTWCMGLLATAGRAHARPVFRLCSQQPACHRAESESHSTVSGMMWRSLIHINTQHLPSGLCWSC